MARIRSQGQQVQIPETPFSKHDLLPSAVSGCYPARQTGLPSSRRIETTSAAGSRLSPENLRIPMMSISRSEVMAISAERSDARLFQFETVIDIRQGFCWFSVLFICLFFRR